MIDFPEHLYRLRLRWYREWDEGDHARLRVVYRDDALGKDLAIETIVPYHYRHLKATFECARTYMLRRMTEVAEAYKQEDARVHLRRRTA